MFKVVRTSRGSVMLIHPATGVQWWFRNIFRVKRWLIHHGYHCQNA